LLRAQPTVAPRARAAIRYRPDAESFFRHDDPLARVAALPGLLAVEVEPRAPWPPLEELDPFTCNLTIKVLLSCSPEEARAALGGAIGSCEVEDTRTRSAATEGPATAQAHELLAAQLELLGDSDGGSTATHIASAGLVAANVLRHLGRHADAERIAAITTESAARGAPAELRRALAALLEPRAAPAAPAEPPKTHREQTLRVAAPRVDTLVRLTGELTVAKNAIGHTLKLAENEGNALAPALRERHEALDRLVGEIQRSVLTLRVLPLRAAFQRFPRLVREMAADLGKPTTLVMEGEHTEADKAIVELIGEPLVHVLRNAMDHGIEDEAARAAAGKPPVATIRLRALREGDHVLIEVTDDGRGIDVARVREVALERHVVPADALASMNDAEVLGLVFEPGFSTANVVTGLSGRGVGLDAVRTAVKRLGGQVAVGRSGPDGTTVRLTLPFSVMMTEVMTVDAGGQSFGIPLESVVETLRIPRSELLPVGAAHAIVLRDRTVPLVDLALSLGAPAAIPADDSALLVIVEANGDLGALKVEKIGERLAVMLKPPEGILAALPGIAGYTLVGDGSVLLVLDLEEVLQ
jgi:two-component system chemotaxis sensor kinase CheA